MCTELDHSAIFDLSISQYGDNATTNVVALGLLVGLLYALLVRDLAVLANAGILVNNGVADFGVVTNTNGQATLVQQGLPLLVRLVVVSTHDHGVLHTQSAHKQHTPEDLASYLFACKQMHPISLLEDAARRMVMMLWTMHDTDMLLMHGLD